MLDIEMDVQAERVVLVVRGEVDLASADQLEAAICAAEATGSPAILIDVDGVSFMDAAGLSVLVRHALAERRRGTLGVTRGSFPVARLLELTGLTSVFRSCAAA